MDSYTIRLFISLSETLHFGKTSAACNISPSALSRQISRLEEEVGVRLFDRDNRGVGLTQAGRIFVEYAKDQEARFLDLRNRLLEESSSLKGETLHILLRDSCLQRASGPFAAIPRPVPRCAYQA
jgi:LysR family positive regulator for ilvC